MQRKIMATVVEYSDVSFEVKEGETFGFLGPMVQENRQR